MATTRPSTLRERIAALQQRGTSPQPSSPPRSQTPTNTTKTGGPALRDKIARFEQKGGTPIPRGSFGLGASLPTAGRRNNELWGNRISSVGRRPGTDAAPTGRSVLLPVGSPNRTRRVSMADAHLDSTLRPQEDLRAASGQEHHVSEDTARESDMIKSLDIATRTPTSPSFNASVASPAKQASLQSNKTPVRSVPPEPIPESPPPPVSLLSPVIIIREDDEQEGEPIPTPVTPDDSPSETVSQVEGPNINSYTTSEDTRENDIINTPLTPVPTTIASERPSTLLGAMSDVSGSPGQGEEEMSKLGPSCLPDQIIVPELQTSRDGECLSAEMPSVADLIDPRLTVAGPTVATHKVSQMSTDMGHDPAASSEDSSPTQPHTPVPVALTDSDKTELVTQDQLSQKTPKLEGAPLRLDEPTPVASPIKDPVFLIVAESMVTLTEEPTLHDLTTPSGSDRTFSSLEKTEPPHDVATEQPSYPEPLVPASISAEVTPEPRMPLNPLHDIPESSGLTIPDSTLQSPDRSEQTDTRTSPVASSSMSDTSCDSPHVTPILDAFPAVPRNLPPTSLPTRARTISGHPRSAIDRRSASSASSTKSTPSLSFSSNSSSTSSPTSTLIPAPQAPPSTRGPASALQRSKSQTTRSRPISSVPAWYDDDSDDGEVGWANVVVTTRRY